MRTKTIVYSAIFLVSGIIVFLGNHYFSVFNFQNKKPIPAVLAPLSIGVVDINKIKSNSKVFLKFREKFDGRNSLIHKEIVEQETKLQNEYNEMRKHEEQAKEITPDFVKKKSDLYKKLAELQNISRQRRDDLYEDYSKALDNIKNTLKTIMDDLGKVYGLKIIFNKSLGDGTQMDQTIILYCKDGLDLTDDIINRFDIQMANQDY